MLRPGVVMEDIDLTERRPPPCVPPPIPKRKSAQRIEIDDERAARLFASISGEVVVAVREPVTTMLVEAPPVVIPPPLPQMVPIVRPPPEVARPEAPTPASPPVIARRSELQVDEPEPTTYFERPALVTLRRWWPHAAVGGVALVAIVATFVALRTGTPAAKVAATPAASPEHRVAAPAPPPPPPVAQPKLAFNPLAITSQPAGAIVTIVGDGDATVIGRTPVTASLDPARAYDVVVAARGHATQLRHVEPGVRELAIDLDPPAPAARTAATGTLQIASKPPCEIIIDGKPTKLMTPQRAITLAPGSHAVTLINSQLKIKKTTSIAVDAHHVTKLIQDFTKR